VFPGEMGRYRKRAGLAFVENQSASRRTNEPHRRKLRVMLSSLA
jgi:hypothetical protein